MKVFKIKYRNYKIIKNKNKQKTKLKNMFFNLAKCF